MAKNILIFSDGTGQVGGLRPDQRLSNVYKLFRATRPGSDSKVDPTKQIAFYDAGLGTEEVGGFFTIKKRIRKLFAAAFGTGIDENVIDCYAAIIANYSPDDRIVLIGFSRGAYTVRSVANVMNLCGVPMHDANGEPVPKHGPSLRKISDEAVRDVYNHGAGSKRDKYEDQREEKARRFRKKYGSEGIGAEGEGQGNVQPEFVGIFDTVAALKSRTVFLIVGVVFLVSLWSGLYFRISWVSLLAALSLVVILYWGFRSGFSRFKYYFEDADRKVRWWNPLDWIAALRSGHIAWWSGKNYDRYVDREIPTLRHALSIDEARKKFPKVSWARPKDVTWNKERGNPDWLVQMWFSGNHSDIGGSYPEEESRLSDIALGWMAGELRHAIPSIEIQHDYLNISPDSLGLQHDEIQRVLDMQFAWWRRITLNRVTWCRRVRKIHPKAKLHKSVVERLDAKTVPQMGRVKAYNPSNLADHVCHKVPGTQLVNISRSIWDR